MRNTPPPPPLSELSTAELTDQLFRGDHAAATGRRADLKRLGIRSSIRLEDSPLDLRDQLPHYDLR
jgi:hypothetical protein